MHIRYYNFNFNYICYWYTYVEAMQVSLYSYGDSTLIQLYIQCRFADLKEVYFLECQLLRLMLAK